MDPYSAEGELVNIHTAFHQGQYKAVRDFDTSAFSSENSLAARVLKLRAQCALHDYRTVISSISNSEAQSTPDLAAAKILAQHSASPSSSEPVSAAESLASSHGDNLSVQLLCGTVLANVGKTDEALALLSQHQGSLDAVALIVQIHLLMNRTDLAVKEARSARGFAQDALLVNLAESWIGIREGGEKYQQSFYVFEELAQAPGSQATTSLTAQAVSELHLGRLPEAETALQQVLALEPDNADALANSVVLRTIQGETAEADAAREKLATVEATHPLLAEIARKKEAFDAAAAKYSPKFEP